MSLEYWFSSSEKSNLSLVTFLRKPICLFRKFGLRVGSWSGARLEVYRGALREWRPVDAIFVISSVSLQDLPERSLHLCLAPQFLAVAMRG